MIFPLASVTYVSLAVILLGPEKKYFKANLNFKREHFRDNVGVQYGHSYSCELALDYAAGKGDTIFLLLTTLGVVFYRITPLLRREA